MMPEQGRVVRCIAGKEQGGFYVVTGSENGFVFLADGKHRTLDRPKRKNIRHIRLTNTVWDIAGMTDRMLHRQLREYTQGGN